MSPETLRLDRIFLGVGRITRATGTTIPAVFRRINRMLTALYESGRLDILIAIRDGHVSPMQVYHAHQNETLHELPVGATMPQLADALEEWIERVAPEYSDEHVKNLAKARRYFKKTDPKARIADLPQLLETMRHTLGVKHPRSWNYCRSAALAFIRSTLKKNHPLWLACSAVEPRKLTKRPARMPVTPVMMRKWFPRPQTDKVDAIAWSLVTTGMGSKELWGAWETRRDRVHIEGTKRAGRVRDVPLVRAPTVPQLSRVRFQKVFRTRMSAHGVTPYDLRRTYANWLESAGVPRTRRRMYYGHGAKDVSDLYEEYEITAYLVEDAKKMAEFLRSPTIRHTTARSKRA